MQAQAREARRVSEILRKTHEKDVKLQTLKEHRDHENACRNLEKKLDLDLKREKVSQLHSVHTPLPSLGLPSNAGVAVHCSMTLLCRCMVMHEHRAPFDTAFVNHVGFA